MHGFALAGGSARQSFIASQPSLAFTSLSSAGEFRLHQVGQWIRSELIAFDIGSQFSAPVNNRGRQRMVHQAFIWKVVDSNQAAHCWIVGDRRTSPSSIGANTRSILLAPHSRRMS